MYELEALGLPAASIGKINRKVYSMSMNPRVKNPLILSIVSTVFMIPVIILAMYLFDSINWTMLIAIAVIYLIVIFLVFFCYGSLSKK